MIGTYEERELEEVSQVLVQSFQTVDRLGSTRWQVIPPRTSNLLIQVDMKEGWLLFQAPLVIDAPQDTEVLFELMWEFLQRNAELPGQVKFGLLPGPVKEITENPPTPPFAKGGIHQEKFSPVRSCMAASFAYQELFSSLGSTIWILAELSLEDGAHLVERVNEVSMGFTAALERLPAERGTEVEHLGTSGRTNHSGERDGSSVHHDLRRISEETGWPFVERDRGYLAVTLDVPNGFYQAWVERNSGGTHLSIELMTSDLLRPLTKQALALLLLRACGHIRMARAVVTENAGRPITARFEVVLHDPFSASEFTHALSALSLACRLCGREIDVVQQDGDIAKVYLAQNGYFFATTTQPTPLIPKGGSQKEERDGTDSNTNDRDSSQ